MERYYVGTRLTSEEKRKLILLAAEKNRSVSHILWRLITELLKEWEENA